MPEGGRIQMSLEDAFVPRLRRDFLRSDIDGEAVVWSPDRGVPAALDPVTTVMLDVIDGSASIADLGADVQDVVGVPHDVARTQVLRTVGLLDEAGILTTSTDWGDQARAAILRRDYFEGPLNH